MEHTEIKNPLVVGKNNRNIYLAKPNDFFENLTSGKIGRISKEDSQRFFNIPIALNVFCEKNPCLKKLIEIGGFTLEENKND